MESSLGDGLDNLLSRIHETSLAQPEYLDQSENDRSDTSAYPSNTRSRYAIS